ncbi:MAG: hypothetical protein KU29_10240 [Sulfurovum sp. FS06-10]|jgi:hypothetical protein|nr:MAG: hypothetical protein KU29_10240 [Sulfurovum sp. FS06-10]
MINSLKKIFPHIEEKECLQYISKQSFEIFDHEADKKCYILEENGQFKVINTHQKEIGFIAVDECLFSSSDGSRADCIVFDNKLFCFIELKHCKNKNIPSNRRTAKKQLMATIEFFREKIDIPQKLEAYICVTCSSNEEKITMTPRANNEEAQLEFEEFLNTQLFYKCEKKFI